MALAPKSFLYEVNAGTGVATITRNRSRATGGAGLVFTEMTNVSAEGRISPGCAGMYRPEHVGAWRRIVDFVHRHTTARIALQLGHAGRT